MPHQLFFQNMIIKEDLNNNNNHMDDDKADAQHNVVVVPRLPSSVWRDSILPCVLDRPSWNACVRTHKELYDATVDLDRPWPRSYSLGGGGDGSDDDEKRQLPRRESWKLLFSPTGRQLFVWSIKKHHQQQQSPPNYNNNNNKRNAEENDRPLVVLDRIRGPTTILSRVNDETVASSSLRGMVCSPNNTQPMMVMMATPVELLPVRDESSASPSSSSSLRLHTLGDRTTNRDWDEKALAFSPCGRYVVSVAFKRRRPGRRRGGEVSLRIWSVVGGGATSHYSSILHSTVAWQGVPNVYEFGPYDDWNMYCCATTTSSNNNYNYNNNQLKVILEHSSELNAEQRRLFVWEPSLDVVVVVVEPQSSSHNHSNNIATTILPSFLGFHGKLLDISANRRFVAVAVARVLPRAQPILEYELQILDACSSLRGRFPVVRTISPDSTHSSTDPHIHAAFTMDSNHLVIAQEEQEEEQEDTDDNDGRHYYKIQLHPLVQPPPNTTASEQLQPLTIFQGSCYSFESLTVGRDERHDVGAGSDAGQENCRRTASRSRQQAVGVLAAAYLEQPDGPLQLRFFDLHCTK
jgi:hypothetical protein